LLCRELGCATLQSKREVRGTRYVALGIEPDAALFEFGDNAAATLATPTTLAGAAKALLLDVQQQTQRQHEVAAGRCNASVTLASPEYRSLSPVAPDHSGMVRAAAELEAQHRCKAELALPTLY
jgi:hypothetical protein